MDAVSVALFVLSLEDNLIGFMPYTSPPLERTETDRGFPVFTVGGLSFTVEFYHEEWMDGVLVMRSDTDIPDETVEIPRSGQIDNDMRQVIYLYFLSHILATGVTS